MGIFTQKCSGCGRTISKRAKHCSGCGQPTDAALVQCGECGATVGAASDFCWHCGTPQQIEVWNQIVRGSWRRESGQVAIRLQFGTPRFNRYPVLDVGDGVAGLLQWADGASPRLLASGRHVIDGFWNRALGMARARPHCAVLCDAGEIAITMLMGGLTWRGRDPLEASMRAKVRIVDIVTFVREVVGDRASFTSGDLNRALSGAARPALETELSLCTREQLAEHSSTATLTNRCEDRLKPVFTALGLALFALDSVAVKDEALERLRAIENELERLALEREPNRLLRAALLETKTTQRRDELGLEESLARIDCEGQLGAIDRVETVKRAEVVASHRISMHQWRLAAELRTAEAEAESDRARLLREAEAKAELDVARAGLETWELVEETKRLSRDRREARKLEIERERMAQRGAADAWTLLSTIEGEQADRILRLRELELQRDGGKSDRRHLPTNAEPGGTMARPDEETLGSDKCRHEAPVR